MYSLSSVFYLCISIDSREVLIDGCISKGS